VKAGRAIGVIAAGVAGIVLGATAMLAIQGTAVTPRGGPGSVRAVQPDSIERRPEAPDALLAWTPGRMPSGFRSAAERLNAVENVTVVRSGTAWMTSSRSDNGPLVDHPRKRLAIPMEVAGVDPGSYRPFVPPGERRGVEELGGRSVFLGESSARLRRLGPGATLRFGGVEVEVAGILPDELVGAHEVLASTKTARRLGVTRPRYALIDPRQHVRDRALTRALQSLTPGPMQIRRPGETPYFRQGDAVLPPVSLKELFGEFAARPSPHGYLQIDPDWERAHLATKRVPLLGKIRCNRGIFPQLIGALREIRRQGLGHLIHSSDGCYSPRFINRDPGLGLSHHAWGIAFDLNAAENPFGGVPRQDRRLVEIFRDWGFTWGGGWIVPDAMHFEYQRPPTR